MVTPRKDLNILITTKVITLTLNPDSLWAMNRLMANDQSQRCRLHPQVYPIIARI